MLQYWVLATFVVDWEGEMLRRYLEKAPAIPKPWLISPSRLDRRLTRLFFCLYHSARQKQPN
jgi:hypothetical protein